MKKYNKKVFSLEIVMLLVGLVFLFPAYVLFNLAFKREADLTSAYLPPVDPTLFNFTEVWVEGNLLGAIRNSAIVTIVSIIFVIIFGALASYPLARVTRKWSTLFFFFFIGGLLLPYQLSLIPLYTTMRDLGLLGTLPSLIIFYIGREMPFAIFLYTAFLRAIPKEYEEAAAIDGAGLFATFRRVLFPMLRPVTGSVAILAGVYVYNDFFTPLLYLSGTGQQTTTVAISVFVGEFRSQWNLVFAGLILSNAPILLIYFFMQKTIIKGFGGGLKG